MNKGIVRRILYFRLLYCACELDSAHIIHQDTDLQISELIEFRYTIPLDIGVNCELGNGHSMLAAVAHDVDETRDFERCGNSTFIKGHFSTRGSQATRRAQGGRGWRISTRTHQRSGPRRGNIKIGMSEPPRRGRRSTCVNSDVIRIDSDVRWTRCVDRQIPGF